MGDYIVIEAVCEECGVINDHLTTHCPNRITPPVEPTSLHVALPLVVPPIVMHPLQAGAVWYPQR